MGINKDSGGRLSWFCPQQFVPYGKMINKIRWAGPFSRGVLDYGPMGALRSLVEVSEVTGRRVRTTRGLRNERAT